MPEGLRHTSRKASRSMCSVQTLVTLLLQQPSEGKTSEPQLLPLQRDWGALPSLQSIINGGESPMSLLMQASAWKQGCPELMVKGNTHFTPSASTKTKHTSSRKKKVFSGFHKPFKGSPSLPFSSCVCFSIYPPSSCVIQDMRFLNFTYMITTAKYFEEEFCADLHQVRNVLLFTILPLYYKTSDCTISEFLTHNSPLLYTSNLVEI